MLNALCGCLIYERDALAHGRFFTGLRLWGRAVAWSNAVARSGTSLAVHGIDGFPMARLLFPPIRVMQKNAKRNIRDVSEFW